MKKKRMNRLHLFILIVAIIFVPILVSVLSTAPQKAHADDEKPPIDYWLDKGSKKYKESSILEIGKGSYQTVTGPTYSGNISMPGFAKKTMTAFLDVPMPTPKKLKNLNLLPAGKNPDARMHLCDNIRFYAGVDLCWDAYFVDMDILHYKNGNFIKKRTIKESPMPTKSNRHIRSFKLDKSNFEENGVYILHIRTFGVKAYYYNSKNSATLFKDIVFAFQIGNDEFCDNYNG